MKLGWVSVSYPQSWAIKPCGDSPMTILRMTRVSLWEPCRSVFSTLQVLLSTFFLKKNIVLQSKSLYNLVAGQLPKYICPSLNCLLFFTHSLYFPTSSLPTTTKLLQSPAPMWLLHVASDSDAGGTPNLLSTAYCLVPKESPHFILSLKVKP